MIKELQDKVNALQSDRDQLAHRNHLLQKVAVISGAQPVPISAQSNLAEV